jgi:NADPH-dependent 7-cyano-7-deazaguanine reductase QueF-like protein
MTDQSDHVVLPRAAVDEFRAWAKLQQSVPWADAYSAMMLKRIDDLLAAAKPAVDAGVWFYGLDDWGEAEISPTDETPEKLVTKHGIRQFYIAADAAEEG